MSDPEKEQTLTTAVARLWPELPALVTGDWEAFESAVLDGLRRISAAEADLADAVDDEAADLAQADLDDAVRDLPKVFKPYPEAARRLNRLWTEALTDTRDTRGTETTGPAGSVRNHRYLEVPVFYATDRRPAPVAGDRDGGGYYTGEAADELSFGVLRVSIPDRRRRGRLPKPRLWHLGFNPRRFVEVIGGDPLDETAFFADPRLALPDAGPPGPADVADQRDVLLFVHGYNVTFTDAVRRAAQLAYDINFLGIPMLYSWPSKGMTPGYVADRENAYASVDHLVTFLESVIARLGPRRIHVIAHSMGNHVLVEALQLLGRTQNPRLGHVVMVAPDVSEQMFKRRAAVFAALAARCTVYASARDRALQLSEWLSGNLRAGQTTPQATPAATVDTIDASNIPGDLLNHSTFAQNQRFLDDIESLVRLGHPPEKRPGLRRGPASPYWVFEA
ncbi:hypothetical protein Ait01nite_029230 [Actinoplanes italicus]|uniref:Esterase/lipase superfamily enzyme n=1 Tax=Actinoplanes italicus TaxID=113567 RepID=A0A2T0KIN2_9ACTN|nr:alpha/beta hydrolase [Actinoplanes italicus]PRX23378.1 esterase/lipase superfamily enzyme [Actinoplanes italicus]GIE29878.1 hypothetical protein Ait01nite_029230 [Actinoplanes italicus]